MQALAAGTIHADVLFVGDRKLAMGPAGELVVDGSVNILGDISVAGDLKVDGAILGKPLTVEKINVSTGSTQADGKSKASIGEATITAGQTEVIVETTAITDKSKVFVTATTSTGGQTPYVVEKTAGESFKVKIDNPTASDITFDWFIIN